ncbi:MAG: penicillin-binding protein 2 [Gammaproteobacteria bacterium]|nr:penicillin-binding protein 2 [Gammaproteobacteria bacterium]
MVRTTIKDHQGERRLYRRRLLITLLLSLVGVSALIGRLHHLQITNHAHYQTLSRANRINLEPLPPTRGLIVDRFDRVLAENRSSLSLGIVPDQVPDLPDTLEQLAQMFGLTAEELDHFDSIRKQKRRFDRVPLKRWLSEEEAARFATQRHRFPGVDIQGTLYRHYPYAELTAHLLGYTSAINAKELAELERSVYRATHTIGKSGVERQFEATLHGQPGLQQVEVNARGRSLRVLEQQPPKSGQMLRLTLDLDVQRAATEALGDRRGAVVAIDATDGGILALVSTPSFNPNNFVRGISTNDYQALINSPNQPLYNRAIRGRYPPGSTIKPFLGFAGLTLQSGNAIHTTYCPGWFQLEGQSHKYRCWKRGGHGNLDLDMAIIRSCDVYFYRLASVLGIDAMHDFLAGFDFGRKTGIELPGENPGLNPSRAWKEAHFGVAWYPGESVINGIGQGFMLATPLQLATATAMLSRRNPGLRPTVVLDSATPSPPPAPAPAWDEDNWQQIVDAMEMVVSHPRGTAHILSTDLAYTMAAKTGTAQVFGIPQGEEYEEEELAERLKDHALFIAFAPVEDPRIAVAVVVENGGHGGSAAGPVARATLDAYLLPRLGL